MPSVITHRSLPLQLLLLLLALAPLSGALGTAVSHDEGRRLVSGGGRPLLAPYRRDALGPPSIGEKLLALVLPALAVTGISLLFPSIVTVNAGRRRRRTAADSEDANLDQLAVHLGKMFAAAVEGDECMQRVACEIGVASSTSLHPRHHKFVERLVTSIAPDKYTTLLNNFKAGATTERCDKNACNVIDLDPDQ